MIDDCLRLSTSRSDAVGHAACIRLSNNLPSRAQLTTASSKRNKRSLKLYVRFVAFGHIFPRYHIVGEEVTLDFGCLQLASSIFILSFCTILYWKICLRSFKPTAQHGRRRQLEIQLLGLLVPILSLYFNPSCVARVCYTDPDCRLESHILTMLRIRTYPSPPQSKRS